MWALFALVASLGFAGFLLVNQQYKVDPTAIMLWRCGGVCLAFFPAVFFVSWPPVTAFYVAAALTAVVISFGDRAVFRLSATYGAGVTSRLMPLSILATFVAWLALDGGQRQALLHAPWVAAGIVMAVLGCMLCALLMRRDPVSAGALRAIAPWLLVFAIVDIGNKTAMTIGVHSVGPFSAVVLYAFLISGIAGLIVVVQTLILRPDFAWAEVRRGRVVKAGALLAVAACVLLSNRPASMGLAPNAAYVTALMLCGSVWIILFNRLRAVPDRSNLWAGLGVVASALALVAISALAPATGPPAFITQWLPEAGAEAGDAAQAP